MKKFWARTCLVAIGIITALIFGELFVDKFFPQPVFRELYPYDFHCFTRGDYYWLKLKPNSNCPLKSNIDSFDPVYIKTNSMGLRNPEINPAKGENTLRILFLGDSYTIGWGISEEETFPRVTENYLQKLYPDKKIEVINGGLTGTGIGYHYLFYKNEALRLNPDIVVIGFYLYNDIPENMFLAKWEEDENGLPKSIDSTFFYTDSNGMFYPKTIPLQYKIPYLRQSQLFILLMNKFPQSSTNYVFNSRFLDPHICFYKKGCTSLDDAKERARKLFEEIRNLTLKNNQKFLVVFIPAEFQIDIKTRINYVPIPLLPSEKEYPYQYFKGFFDEIGVDYLDLRPNLSNYPNGQLFLENDDHFNPMGHKVTAQAISEKLLDMIKKETP